MVRKMKFLNRIWYAIKYFFKSILEVILWMISWGGGEPVDIEPLKIFVGLIGFFMLCAGFAYILIRLA